MHVHVAVASQVYDMSTEGTLKSLQEHCQLLNAACSDASGHQYSNYCVHKHVHIPTNLQRLDEMVVIQPQGHKVQDLCSEGMQCNAVLRVAACLSACCTHGTFSKSSSPALSSFPPAMLSLFNHW